MRRNRAPCFGSTLKWGTKNKLLRFEIPFKLQEACYTIGKLKSRKFCALMTCHGKFDIKNLKFGVWKITAMRLKTFCLLVFKYIADKFLFFRWYQWNWRGGVGVGEMNIS